MPDAVVGVPYTQALSGAGGTAPYAFDVVSGELPAGLTLTDATIAGTPTAAGASTFTVRATDDDGNQGQREYTLAVTAPAGRPDADPPNPTPTPSPRPTATASPAPTVTPDTTKPRITGVKVSKKGRLSFSLSEPAAVRITLERRKGKTFKRVGKVRRLAGAAGANAVRLGKLKKGRYRVSLAATDAAGNASARSRKAFRKRG